MKNVCTKLPLPTAYPYAKTCFLHSLSLENNISELSVTQTNNKEGCICSHRTPKLFDPEQPMEINNAMNFQHSDISQYFSLHLKL